MALQAETGFSGICGLRVLLNWMLVHGSVEEVASCQALYFTSYLVAFRFIVETHSPVEMVFVLKIGTDYRSKENVFLSTLYFKM